MTTPSPWIPATEEAGVVDGEPHARWTVPGPRPDEDAAGTNPSTPRRWLPSRPFVPSSREASAVQTYCAELCPPLEATAASVEALQTFTGRERAELLAHTRVVAAGHTDAGLDRQRRRRRNRRAGCESTPHLLAAGADGSLSAPERADLDAHLTSCLRCQAYELRSQRAERAFAGILDSGTAVADADRADLIPSAEDEGTERRDPASWLPEAALAAGAAAAAGGSVATADASGAVPPPAASEDRRPGRSRIVGAVIASAVVVACAVAAIVLTTSSNKGHSTTSSSVTSAHHSSPASARPRHRGAARRGRHGTTAARRHRQAARARHRAAVARRSHHAKRGAHSHPTRATAPATPVTASAPPPTETPVVSAPPATPPPAPVTSAPSSPAPSTPRVSAQQPSLGAVNAPTQSIGSK